MQETRNGKVTTYTYDALGQLIRVNDPNDPTAGESGTTWVYEYDRGGNILSKSYHSYTTGTPGVAIDTVAYSYTDNNWKDKLTAYDGQAITYDAIGNPLNDGRRRYEWQAGRQLKKVYVKADLKEGTKAGVDEQTGTVLKIEWSNGNLLDGEVATTQASATVTRCGVDVTDEYAENAFHWTRNSGNIEADAVWNAAHAGMKSITFAEADIDGDVKISCTLTGNSATYGSITVDDDMDASHTPAELDANDVFVIENGYLKVTTSRGNAYVLENGRLKAAGAKLNGSITAETRLFASQPENIVEFSYDFNRQRTQKKVTKNDGDVEIFNYTLYGKLLMHLSCGLNEMHFFYDGNKRPAAVEFNGTFYSYIQNSQGDIVGIIDNNGDIVVEYRYDAWGKMVMMKSKDIEYNLLAEMNPFRYRGYIWDGEMDLFYLRNRYYEDSVGRFINADSLLGLDYGLIGHNTFAYCLNKPVEMCDCDGRSVGGATAYSFSQGATYQNYLKNKDREEYDARVRESYLNRIEENKRLEKRASDARKLGISLRGVPENLMPLNKHTIEKSYVYLEASITIDYFVDENGINYMRVSNLSWSVPDDYEDNVKQIDLVYTSGTAFSREYRFMMDCTYNGKILNVGGGATPTPQNISACSLSVILMFNDGSKNSVTIGEDNIIGIFSEIMPTTK